MLTCKQERERASAKLRSELQTVAEARDAARSRCLLTYAHVCSRMLTYAEARDAARSRCLLTYAYVCSRMLTYAHVS